MSTLPTIDEDQTDSPSRAVHGPRSPLLGFRIHLIPEADDDDMDYEPATTTEADEDDEMDEDEPQEEEEEDDDDDGETEGEYHGGLQCADLVCLYYHLQC